MITPTFGGFPFNASLWGGGAASVTLYSSDLVVFEGFSLSDGTSIVCTDLIDSGPTREIIGGNIPRGDGMYTNGTYWREKTIEIRGFLQASTAAALDALIDTLRMNLKTPEGALDITRYGTARRFIATLINAETLVADRQRFHVTLCPFVARFSCKVPFGTDRDYTVNTFSITSSPTNQVVSNTGTAEAQPIFAFIFDAASSVTVVNVKRIATTGSTLDEIEYSGSIAAGDLLMFNSESKTVLKNSVAVDFTGSFPTLDTGSNTIKVTVTGSAFTITGTVSFKNAYL